ncbi:cytochrome-c peroxidase [Rhizobium phaseoli]|uniref:cytochrome-c peroxidase n=1 Tax=Rhizobium phaseoli TaxID=396 RepID=UPI0007F1582C|nr:cytochrome c peroxidase [Rhizobium phaseoli]ANL39529.1 cytochrome-c peroxidase protein [Rhizobium phaseoli]ANL58518.1 cytochrome-c peroxidase protein [Rhizobium phaseoli]
MKNAISGSVNGVRNIGLFLIIASSCAVPSIIWAQSTNPDHELKQLLARYNFTGNTQATLEKKHPVDEKLAAIGQNLFFDRILGLSNDNSCSGCHSPQFAFADSQSIAIGVDNNCRVGPGRVGPHNQRRSPTVTNAVLYPVMMWNGRFSSISGDGLDNSKGFLFPAPEGNTKFASYDPYVKMLMAAQGHMPSTELPEMAGFPPKGTSLFLTMSKFGGDLALVEDNMIKRLKAPISSSQAKDANLRAFSKSSLSGIQPLTTNACGTTPTPLPIADIPITSLNEPIRREVLKRLDADQGYHKLFADQFPSEPLNFGMIGAALAEFQTKLVFADAPIDKYARGDVNALTDEEKQGAILFFGSAGCVSCHAVNSTGGELFSDFASHNIGVPPLYPSPGEGNVEFLGVNKDTDFGRAEFTGLEDSNAADRYLFRTSPLRNVGLQPTFMHNGAYTKLRDAIAHHLDAPRSLLDYDPAKAGVKGLSRVANRYPILDTIDPTLKPIAASDTELNALTSFVGNALTDPRARKGCDLVPKTLPSGNPLPVFEGC